MRIPIHLLMWAHYIYLLLLPTLAVVSAQMMFPADDFYQVLLILGFPPVLMYTLFLANGYALPESVPVALIVTLAIPLQLGISVLLFDGGSVWLFFAESAAVEITSFVVGTLASAFLIRRNELGGSVFVFLLALVLILFGGGTATYVALVFYGYGGFSAWLLLFVSSFTFALWEYARVYKKVVALSRKSSGPETIVMKFDGGVLTRILGYKKDIPLISPFSAGADQSVMTKPIMIFGFSAMFLPLIVCMIVAVAMGLP